MSNVASKELSRELYELSGWDGTLAVYEQTAGIPIGEPYIAYPELEKRWGLWGTQEFKVQTPAYDAGYLLRKLPDRIQDSHGTWFALMGFPNGVNPWFAYKSTLQGEDSRWPNDKGIPFYKRVFSADTPEDALTSLAIELFKSNVLVKGDVK